ncbi:MAG: hypothetical protein WA655_24445 [Candidatus Korobacteraceae bacterium]
MIVVADSSPLIVLAKLSCFDLLEKLYSRLYISAEVYHEVVVAGAGLPGSQEIEQADWIEVAIVRDPSSLALRQQKSALGLGELSSIVLAREIGADLVLLVDHSARKLARAEGFELRGSIGSLEIAYRQGYLGDLRAAFQRLIENDVYVDRQLLNHRLQLLGLESL